MDDIFLPPLGISSGRVFGFAESHHAPLWRSSTPITVCESWCVNICFYYVYVCALWRVSICVTLPQGPKRRPTSCCHHSDDFIYAAMCSNVYFASQTPTADSHIPVDKDKYRSGGGVWYWLDIDCNQSPARLNTVTVTGHELEQGRDGKQGRQKTETLQPSNDLLHNSARSSLLNLLKSALSGKWTTIKQISQVRHPFYFYFFNCIPSFWQASD